MQKVRLLVHRSDTDTLLSAAQRIGAMEFSETNVAEVGEVTSLFPHENLFPRVQHAVSFLAPYTAKVSLWRSLRDGSLTSLSESEIKKGIADTDVVSAIVEDLEKLQVDFADATDTVRRLEEQQSLLRTWVKLPFKLDNLKTSTTVTKLVSSSETHTHFKVQVEEVLTNADLLFAVTEVSETKLAITFNTDQNLSVVNKLIESVQGEVSIIPEGVEAPDVEIVRISEKLAYEKGRLALLHDQAEHFAITHLKTLQIASEILTWERDRYVTLTSGAATKQTVVFDAWLNADKREALEQSLIESGTPVVISELELAEYEQPPVDISNNSFIQPFEVVTRLYGMPGYKDLDPTVFLAGFFFLFFGMSLTDVGYGAFLMVVSIIILTLFKVPAVIRTFAKLLFFMGLASALVGLLFAGYLGMSPDSLPAALKALQMFDPIGDPLPVFYLALGLGVFQVMVGMVLKIYSDARNGALVDGILDQGPWLFMFCLCIGYLANVTGYISFITADQLINLMYVDILLIVLASGRKGETIMQKVKSAALSLYDSIGYFSDILSYSRLLALGLATTALAFAVNLIAEIVSDSVPYLGPVLALLVLIVGHLFTLAVNTLGAFIHSARLQFVEFFGKFIDGTGKEFKPLKRSEKYVTVTDD